MKINSFEEVMKIDNLTMELKDIQTSIEKLQESNYGHEHDLAIAYLKNAILDIATKLADIGRSC